MDDQFLHRLRREPPTAFAARLKWQLDRPLPARRWRSRLLLGLAICGTAFALVSPPGRRAVSSWFATSTASGPPPAQSEASLPHALSEAPSVDASNGPSPSPRGTPQHFGAAPIAPPGPAPAAEDTEVQPDTHRNDAQPAVVPFTPAAIVPAPPQTPEMHAAAAVALRRGLFMNMSFAMGPLPPMMQRGIPVDFKLAQLSAIRLRTLASMIPEIFQMDTRPFEMNSHAQDSIWTDPKGFEAMNDRLIAATDALATAAETHEEDATVRSIALIGAACRSCHAAFRK
jgi:cytochrome c556